jgi:hypothetical protein
LTVYPISIIGKFMRRISLLIILLFVLSAVLATIHHHNDGLSHNDCPICVLSLQSSIVDNHTDQGVTFTYYRHLDLEYEAISCKASERLFSSRAPPPSYS